MRGNVMTASKNAGWFSAVCAALLLAPMFVPASSAQTSENFSVKALSRTAPTNTVADVAPQPCRPLGKIAPRLYRCGYYLVQLNEGATFPDELKNKSWQEAAKTLRGQGSVAKVVASSPDDIVLQGTPNDPRFADEQYFNGGGEAVDVGALEAWGTVTGRSDVIVAVIDSGLAVDHPDLKDNVWK